METLAEDENFYFVGWEVETKSAWRARQSTPDDKEFTKTFRIDDDATDLSPVFGIWNTAGRPWEHEIAAITAGYYREHLKYDEKHPAQGAGDRWRYEVDGCVVKLGHTKAKGKNFKTLLLTTGEMHKVQILQVPMAYEDAESLAQTIATKFLDGEIYGATVKKSNRAVQGLLRLCCQLGGR